MKPGSRLLHIACLIIAVTTITSCSNDNRSQKFDLSPLEQLGRNIYFDKISMPEDEMSCADCHAPEDGYSGPDNETNHISGMYRGAVASRLSNRKPPTAAYATFSPELHFNETEGIFIGGNFWDGRATGKDFTNPAADQAIAPFLNPVEHNMPDAKSVLVHIRNSDYYSLWVSVFGEMSVSATDDIDLNYKNVGEALAAFEASEEVNQFSSKFDYYLKGMVELTREEKLGLDLFNSKGLCRLCHLSEGEKPLFTDFTFDNLGTPKNPDNPFYKMDKVYLDNGEPVNPDGADWVDQGLGGYLATHPDPEWRALAPENMGKHKVPTLRNADKRANPESIKAYMHNGVFKSLKEVVHFYNTRDIKVWPPAEVAENVNKAELGNLGLTDAEEDAIVAFMKTLSDGYIIE